MTDEYDELIKQIEAFDIGEARTKMMMYLIKLHKQGGFMPPHITELRSMSAADLRRAIQQVKVKVQDIGTEI